MEFPLREAIRIAVNHGASVEEIAATIGLSVERVRMACADTSSHMARIEREVKRSLTPEPTVCAAIMTFLDERDFYWEIGYIVVVRKEARPAQPHDTAGRTYSTHHVAISSEGRSEVKWGHYDFKSYEEALADCIKRAS